MRETCACSPVSSMTLTIYHVRWYSCWKPSKRISCLMIASRSVFMSLRTAKQTNQWVLSTQVSSQFSQFYQPNWPVKSINYFDPSEQASDWKDFWHNRIGLIGRHLRPLYRFDWKGFWDHLMEFIGRLLRLLNGFYCEAFETKEWFWFKGFWDHWMDLIVRIPRPLDVFDWEDFETT